MVAALPLTRSARDSLIAISVLWVLGATVTFLRLAGRLRGAGIKADDILALIAVVSLSCIIPVLSCFHLGWKSYVARIQRL
jgi:hypothetical protein